jgi:PAS domain S-box-containing protein
MPLNRWRQQSVLTRRDSYFRRFPLLISAGYALVSILWIAASDTALEYVAADQWRYHEFQTLKGWLFVLGSAALIYYVLNNAWKGIVAAFDSTAESERRLNLALACAGGGIWELDLVGDDARLVHMSEEFTRFLGLPSNKTLTMDDIRSRRHPDDLVRTEEKMQEAIASGGAIAFDVRYRLRSNDGSYRWVHSRGSVVAGSGGRPTRMVGVAMDIDEQVRAEEEIERLKRFDPATGLSKRQEFAAILATAVEADASDKTLGIVQIRLMGLSHLLVEAESGEDAGIIARFAERLRALPDCNAARLAPDVFAIAPTRPLACRDVRRILEEAVETLLQPLDVGSELIRLRAQVGGALGPAHVDAPNELLRNSAHALERADATGDAVIRWSDETLNEQFDLRRARIRSLEHAVAAGEIECYLQPLVDLKTGRTAGFEALARWNRPEEGLVSPDKFIPLAEEFGLIGEIGEEILRQACAAAAAWPSPEPFVAVNVSPLQLDDPAFPRTVRNVLAETGLAAGRLELEITENALPRDAAEAARRIDDLRSLGVQIAIDDFGTGYSSLGLLTRLPFNRLKIDRSFVSSCLETSDGMILIDAMTDLARNLRLSMTAEGVETAEQVAMLAAKGVDLAQGYFFSKPVRRMEAISQVDRDWRAARPAAGRANVVPLEKPAAKSA